MVKTGDSRKDSLLPIASPRPILSNRTCTVLRQGQINKAQLGLNRNVAASFPSRKLDIREEFAVGNAEGWMGNNIRAGDRPP